MESAAGTIPALVVQIVVATNVAETSITIDDVACVVDAGRVKELGYDSERGIARLQVRRHARRIHGPAPTCKRGMTTHSTPGLRTGHNTAVEPTLGSDKRLTWLAMLFRY